MTPDPPGPKDAPSDADIVSGVIVTARTSPTAERSSAKAKARARIAEAKTAAAGGTPTDILSSVLSLVAARAPLRTIVVRDGRAGRRRWIEWHADGVRVPDRRFAKTRAESVYKYLIGASDTLERPQRAGRPEHAVIALPLVDDVGTIIGMVQIDGETEPDLEQLTFASELAELLTKALVASYAWEDSVVARYRAEWLASAREVVLAREEKRRADAEATHDRLTFVANVSALLGASLDYERSLDSVASAAVGQVADACIIDLVRGDGTRTRIAEPPELADAAVAEAIEPMVLANLASGELDPSAVAAAQQRLHVERIVCAPLMRHGETYGTITFLVAAIAPESIDLALAEAVAHRVAAAAHNGRLHEDATAALIRRDVALEMIAHDVRNLANSVLLSAEFMLRHARASEPPATRRPLETIIRSIHGVTRMMADLADASHLGSVGDNFERRDCHARNLVVSACDALNPVALARGIDLRSDVASDLPQVLADPDQIMRVLANLIGNAIKFTPAEGSIWVHAEAAVGEVVFSVTDTGVGIARDDLPRVFERYWQHSGPKRKLGSGLGLAIAKGIVEAHGGRLWVESSVGVATTFRFTLHPSIHG